MEKFLLSEQAAECPNPNWVLDEGGIWREQYGISASGRPVSVNNAVLTTTIPPPPGASKDIVWDEVSSNWRFSDTFMTLTGRMLFEEQYVDGIYTKTNYTSAIPSKYLVLLEAVKGGITANPSTISLKDGKYSLYFGTLDSASEHQAEFGFPDRNWHEVFSLVIDASGTRSIKLYDKDYENYPMPPLPDEATIFMGVATTWRAGSQVGMPEIYFEAPPESLQHWVQQLGLKLPDAPVSYCGITLDEQGHIASLKAINRVTTLDQHKMVDTLCPAPWMHLLTSATGDISPCCVWDGPAVGNIKDMTLAEAANLPEMNSIRKKMLSGEQVSGCKRCTKIENSGAYYLSQRARYTSMLGHLLADDLGATINTDGSLIQPFRMQLINEQFSNLCNFSCRSCSGAQSSMIARENGDTQELKQAVNLRSDYLDEIMQQLETVTAISIVGGEGILIPQYWQMLDRLIDLGRHDDPNLLIYAVTNGSKLSYAGNSLIEYAKKFKKFTVCISIDAIGARGELFRNGTNWVVIERNIRELLAAGIRPAFCVTVNATNIHHLPDLHNYLMENGLLDQNTPLTFSVLTNPEFLSCQILPATFKQEVAKRLETHKASLLAAGLTSGAMVWDGLRDFMLAEDASSLLPEFVDYHKTLDAKRGQDTFQTFSELAFI